VAQPVDGASQETAAPLVCDATVVRRYFAIRLLFAAVWAADATLKWLPGFHDHFVDTIRERSMGQPGWLQPWSHFWIRVGSHSPTKFALLIACAETAICLSLALGFLQRVGFVFGTVFALLIWGVGEGFGGPYTSGATDIGCAVMYAILFLSLTLVVPRSVRAAAPALDNDLVRAVPALAPLTFHHS
jgi:nitrite reductase (NO-forming)